MKKLITVLLGLTLLVGCKSNPEKFVELIQDYADSEGLGATVAVVKEDTIRGEGWVVISVTDDSGNVNYFASDLSQFDPSEIENIDDLLAWASSGAYQEAGVDVYTSDDGNTYEGIYVDSQGNLYETTQATGKDLEKVQAMKELMSVNSVAKKLSRDFGFSVERSYEVAKFMANFNKVSNSRTLTKEDYNAFSKEIIGVDYNELKKATEGDTDAAELLIDSAARQNEVSPEAIKALIESSL